MSLIYTISLTWIYIICCVATVVLMPLVIWYAKKMSLVDVQNSRSSHSGVALRGGGILFILIFYLGILLLSLTSYTTMLSEDIVYLGVGAFIIAVLSWFDDYKKLSSGLRFLVHFLVIGFLVNKFPIADLHIRFLSSLPIWLFKSLIILAWVWFLNLYNFMDGADGLAGQEGLFIILMLSIPFAIYEPYLVALGIGLLGFLYINYPKAKIFMGDIGSTFLGTVFAGILLLNIINGKINLPIAIAITSYFSYDATYTLIKRMLQKKIIWQAHREHWFHRLLISGFSHKQLFWTASFYNIILLGVVVLYKEKSLYALIASVLLFTIYAWFIKYRECKHR